MKKEIGSSVLVLSSIQIMQIRARTYGHNLILVKQANILHVTIVQNDLCDRGLDL